MEVSALPNPTGISGLRGPSALLRLQTDERLIAMTRRGGQAILVGVPRMDAVVTLPADDTVDEVHEEAFELGADLVGGAPHLWPDPIAATDRLLDLAERVGVGADLHADESLEGPITLGRFAERTRTWSLPRSAGWLRCFRSVRDKARRV